MKKFLFLFLTSVLAVFLVTGCADDSSNNSDNGGNGGNTGGQVTTPTMSDINSLQGTYDIEFFYVNAVIAALTTDCSKVTEYVGANATQCANADTDSVDHHGEATITVNEDGSVKVISKVQINGGVFDTNPLIQSLASDKVYNFTEFTTIPANARSGTIINDNETNNQVTGTYGRSATQLVDETKSVNNTFYFYVEADGTVVNRLTDVTVTPADTIIRMKKRSNEVITLDPNTSYGTPVINNFDSAVVYELKNN